MLPSAPIARSLLCCAWLWGGMALSNTASAQQMRATPQLAPLEEQTPPPIAESGPGATAPEGAAQAPQNSDAPGTQGLENVHGASGQVYGDTPTGIPYSSIFRPSGGPLGSFRLPSQADLEAHSESFSGDLSTRLPEVQSGLPFLHRGFAPENAHLKLGPVYVRFGSVSGAVLASDNINLSETDRQTGCIAAIRLGMTVVAQLTEGLQFSAAGTLTYLPFTGDVGLGLGQSSPLLLGAALEPILASQLAYDTMVAGWPVTFADDLAFRRGRYENQTRDDFYLFDSSSAWSEDRAGRYAFAAPKSSPPRSVDSRREQDPGDVMLLSNILSACTTRLLPSEIETSARAFHENLWYYNQTGEGLPSRRDSVTLEAASQRENLRFKPFAGYELVSTDQWSGVDQKMYAGLRGPITEQLTLRAQTGVLLGYDGNTSLLWSLRLQHVAGPYTVESLRWERDVSDFHDQIIQTVGYHLDQVLGPNLQAAYYAQFGKVEDRSGYTLSYDEFRTGLLLAYNVSPRTSLRCGVTYAKLSGDSDLQDSRTLTARFEVSYTPTDSLTARLLYQYQKNDSRSANDSYYENMVSLILTKTFQ